MNLQIPLPRILVYQQKNCQDLIDYLSLTGFNLIVVNEQKVLAELRECTYDLCILDYSSKSNSLDILQFATELNTRIPIIFMSSINDYESIIKVLNAGADDYITKPCNFDEVVARIKALMRRCNVKVRRVENSYRIGDFTFDTGLQLLTFKSEQKRLNEKESRFLALLCAYKNELLPKLLVLRSIWGNENHFTKRSLDVIVCYLRKYLSKDNRIKLETIRGIGYSLVINEEQDD